MSNDAIPLHPMNWRTVSLGTKCLSAGALLSFVGAVFLSIAVAMHFHLFKEQYAAQEIRARGIPDATVLAALFIVTLGLMLGLAGQCLCALAPVESGARPFALGAAACWVLGVLAALQTSLLPAIGFAPFASRAILENRERVPAVIAINEIAFGSSACVFALTASILLTCFLGAVAAHFRNAGLTQRVHRYVIGQLAASAFLVLVGFSYLYVAATWRDAGPWLAAPFIFAALLAVGVGAAWLLRLLAATRTMLAIAEENAQPLEPARAP